MGRGRSLIEGHINLHGAPDNLNDVQYIPIRFTEYKHMQFTSEPQLYRLLMSGLRINRFFKLDVNCLFFSNCSILWVITVYRVWKVLFVIHFHSGLECSEWIRWYKQWKVSAVILNMGTLGVLFDQSDYRTKANCYIKCA